MGSLRRAAAALCVLGLCVSAMPAKSSAEDVDYVIRPGDTVELFVAGAADLRGRFVVQADGSLTLPLLGRISVAQSPLRALQDKAGADYAAKPYRGRAADGRETMIVLQPSDVVVSVVDYQPIYVTGDVSRPGEQIFRPGKTARQAIAVAGGPDVIRYRANHPGVEVAEAAGEQDGLALEIIRRKVAISRLRRELGGDDQVDVEALKRSASDPSAVESIVQLEERQFQSRADDFAKQRAALELSARETEEQLEIMSVQLDKEERGRLADVAELNKAQELLTRGLLPSPRVTDARRAVMLSATRKLQIESQMAQFRRQRSEIASNLSRLGGLRQIDIQDRLATEVSALYAAEAKMAAVSEKLSYLGILKSSLNSPDAGMFRVTVHRKDDSTVVKQEFPLEPGDVVELTLRSSPSPNSFRGSALRQAPPEAPAGEQKAAIPGPRS